MVATQLMRHRAVEAAEELADDGISVRGDRPAHAGAAGPETVVESVGRTSRLVCVQEAPANGSWGSLGGPRMSRPLRVAGRAAAGRRRRRDPDPLRGTASRSCWLPSADRIARASVARSPTRTPWRSTCTSRHAAPVRLDGGGDDRPLAQSTTARGHARPGDRRDRDRQGDDGLRGRRRRDTASIPAEGRPCRWGGHRAPR